MRFFLLFIFCLLSGMASLTYEVIWNRWLLLLFGSTTFSVSLILAVFMAGLALGSLWMGRMGRRISKPVMAYGLIEMGIGLYGAFTPDLFGAVEPAYRWVWQLVSESPAALFALRSGLVFVVLILPTLLMGATLPLLARAFVSMKAQPGSVAGWLYGINTTGAVLGAGLSGFAILPGLGMHRALAVAVGINLGIGLGALWMGVKARFNRPSSPNMIFNSQRPANQAISAPALLMVMAFSGFAAMIYEVAWTRELVLVLGSSTYAFSLMLVAFLIGIAAGSLAVARFKQPVLMLAGIEAGIALLALLGQYGMGRLPEIYLYWYWLMGPSVPALWTGQLLVAFGLMVGPTLLLGASFPLAVRIINGLEPELGRSVGSVYGVNTLGTVFGALAGGLVLIPWFGLEKAVMIGGAVSLLAALALVLSDTLLRIPRRLAFAGTGVGIVALSLTLIPSWDPVWMSSGLYKEAPSYLKLVDTPGQVRKVVSRYRPLFYEEGSQATVSVIERPSFGTQPHLTLAIDGKVDASTGADMSTQVLSGHLPLLIAKHADRVLVIGYASGVTVGSALLHPVRELVAAEIEPSVIRASRYFDDYNHRPLEDPRVRLVLDDGRHYLQTTSERFDVIISEPSNPWMSGPSRLFTREFFELTRRHLSQDGVMAQWIQMYGISPDLLKAVIRTFQGIYPHMLVFQTAPADLLLLGSERPVRLDLSRIKAVFFRPEIVSDLKRIGIDSEWDLMVRLRLGEQELLGFTGAGPINTDDNGLLEFSAPKFLYAETAELNQQLILGAMQKEAESPGVLAYLSFPEPDGKETAQGAVRLGRRFLEEGMPGEAEQLARLALSLKATAEGHWLLGEVQDQQKNHLTALKHWKGALWADPGHPGTLRSLAIYYQERGEFQEAEKFFRQAEQVSAEDRVIHFYHGINLYYLRQHVRAIAHLERFVRTNHEDHQSIIARYYLQKAYEALGEQERAASYYVQVIEKLRSMRIHLEQDQGQKELDRLLRLVQAHSERPVFHAEEVGLKALTTRHLTDPLAHYYRGVSLYFLGYDEEAAGELQKVLERLPEGDDSPWARHYLELIASGRSLGEQESLLFTGL